MCGFTTVLDFFTEKMKRDWFNLLFSIIKYNFICLIMCQINIFISAFVP